MIQTETCLNVANNCGIKKVKCIHINGSTGFSVASIGILIPLAVQEVIPNNSQNYKKGDKCYGVIVRTKKKVKRESGFISFQDNAVVIVDKNTLQIIGTRIFGPISRELKNTSFAKILSLASEVV